MFKNRKPFHADLIVFAVCWSVSCFVAGLWMGQEQGKEAPKVCAVVPGMVPVSSTADTCIYVLNTMGRAHWKMLAKQEERK